MQDSIQNSLKKLAIEQLMQHPLGEKLSEAMQALHQGQQYLCAMAEKQDEPKMTGIKIATILTFSILRKISFGKHPSSFDSEDWEEIARSIANDAILPTDQAYSVFIFGMYEKHIRYSLKLLTENIPEASSIAIELLADQLHNKEEQLKSGAISEIAYTEDCLWISLEAMIKLLASCTILLGDRRIEEFAQAFSSYALAYGRLMLYQRELEIVNQYIEKQHRLDAELGEKYTAYLHDLEEQTHQFYFLMDHAFSPNFKDAFLFSSLLAKECGVDAPDILETEEDIDSFFLS